MRTTNWKVLKKRIEHSSVSSNKNLAIVREWRAPCNVLTHGLGLSCESALQDLSIQLVENQIWHKEKKDVSSIFHPSQAGVLPDLQPRDLNVPPLQREHTERLWARPMWGCHSCYGVQAPWDPSKVHFIHIHSMPFRYCQPRRWRLGNSYPWQLSKMTAWKLLP